MSAPGRRVRSWLTGWRLALRLARRDALRSRGRSVLVLVMIALPVTAVVAADVLQATSSVSGTEALPRELGSASAKVVLAEQGGRVLQAPDPSVGWTTTGRVLHTRVSDLASVLGDAPLVPDEEGSVRVGSDGGVADVTARVLDLRDPLTRGMATLESGRLPASASEVVVNQALLDEGYAVGDALDVRGRDAGPTPPRIVGVVRDATYRTQPVVVGPPGAFHVDTYGNHTFLVGGGPVAWDQVQRLNALGAVVTSRAVLEDPPPLPPQVQEAISSSSGDQVAIVVLIATMALLELVLLAGPAFAVGARRQTRTLALIGASGGTPAQSRRVVMAGAVVLGGAAALAGVVLGIGVARLLQPGVQRVSDSWFGPFEVPWTHALAALVFGLVSALLAAFVPALIASRTDVVAVLTGRRGDRAVRLRFPLLGVAVLAAAVALAAHGARSRDTYAIAGSALVAVVGMILLVPVVVVVVSRLARHWPLPVRYAARDAARHRTRTVPAVAAVAATVAGVVTLGIATSSQAAEKHDTYRPVLAMGTGMLTASGRHTDWDALRADAQRTLGRDVTGTVEGVVTDRQGRPFVDVHSTRTEQTLYSNGTSLGSSVLVSDGALPATLPDLDDADRAAAARVLGAGGVVSFGSEPRHLGRVAVTVGNRHPRQASARALFLPVSAQYWSGPQAVLPTSMARSLGLDVATVGLELPAGTSSEEEKALTEAAAGTQADALVYVERGYQPDSETLIALLVLAGLGGVLMLGGTLTATFLALSDARPDLATLAAVGASPRTRRSVAASYAVVVGVVGALLGTAVGFVPGLAVAFPLTSDPGTSAGPFIDVPWLLIGTLVVALPLLTAAVVWLAARSRLPLVARLD